MVRGRPRDGVAARLPELAAEIEAKIAAALASPRAVRARARRAHDEPRWPLEE
jgi:hypothetical protein